MLRFKPTSAKLWELSSRLGTMQMSHQSRGGLSLGTLPAWVPSLPPLLSPSDLIISCPHWLWSLCSLLPECVQLNTGSRGRCWPWLEGSSRSRGCQPPKPTASHWVPPPGSLRREAGCALGRGDKEHGRRDRSKGSVWKLREKKKWNFGLGHIFGWHHQLNGHEFE